MTAARSIRLRNDRHNLMSRHRSDGFQARASQFRRAHEDDAHDATSSNRATRRFQGNNEARELQQAARLPHLLICVLEGIMELAALEYLA